MAFLPTGNEMSTIFLLKPDKYLAEDRMIFNAAISSLQIDRRRKMTQWKRICNSWYKQAKSRSGFNTHWVNTWPWAVDLMSVLPSCWLLQRKRRLNTRILNLWEGNYPHGKYNRCMTRIHHGRHKLCSSCITVEGILMKQDHRWRAHFDRLSLCQTIRAAQI